MRVLRVLRTLAVGGAALAAMGAAPAHPDIPGPEADLAYHGSATMTGGRVDVRFTPRNHGPSAVPDATVRLRWSKPLADAQTLPEGCARSGERVVVCRTGALAADAVGERIEVRVRLRDASSEVLLELDTVWGGGAVDGNRANDQQRVLVLDTGDTYYF
ncbi:hypothetical protein [Streptomyces sp. NBC_00986]|uniref:hypothetical protein n=1 Tax=Streptomyces sp. NBC_00986 TaxID=2903702 RepID=UPI00386E3F66|nr:hypothetical protein OG504_23795 [Streptomyces sp. NBC_00986]